MQGNKEILGLWIANNEGAKFWLSIVTELRNRGLQDVFIFCVDGLKGFPEAITAVFPKSQIQLCIVHMVRNSLKFVPTKNRKEVSADLKLIYSSINEEEARKQLNCFKTKWDNKYPSISDSWNRGLKSNRTKTYAKKVQSKFRIYYLPATIPGCWLNCGTSRIIDCSNKRVS